MKNLEILYDTLEALYTEIVKSYVVQIKGLSNISSI